VSDNMDFGSSPMRDAAVSMHELYQTLKSVGFSRKDALELVSKILTSSISEAVRIAQEEQEEDE